MHAGKLTRDELATWTLNRYYYQTRIPIKDAIILSKSEDPAFRRAWIRRIHDHDGDASIRRRAGWRCGCGWPRRSAWIATRWRAAGACCRACASPATLRQPVPREPAGGGGGVVADRDVRARPDVGAHRRLGEALPVGRAPRRSAYFRARVPRARRDGEEGLAFVVANATSRALQEACVGGAGPQDRDPVAPGRLRAGGDRRGRRRPR